MTYRYISEIHQVPNGTEDRVYSITGLLDGIIDPDGDELFVENLSVDRGSLQENDDTYWSYIPEDNYNGIVRFSYLVSDGTGKVSIHKTLKIEGVDDVPEQTGLSLLFQEVAKIVFIQ